VTSSTALTTHTSRLSSPRTQRRLLWIGGAVLVAGVAAFVSTVVWTGPHKQAVPLSNRPAQIAKKEKTVPLEPGAKVVGEEFIRTAVARHDLEAAWKITAPALRGSFTLAQWKSGAIPVVPYPADTSKPSPVKVEYSYRNKALLMVLLTPKAGVKTKPQLFLIGLRAFGQGKSRHWLVEYWMPYGAPKIPQA
jgi:hypothetical protein